MWRRGAPELPEAYRFSAPALEFFFFYFLKDTKIMSIQKKYFIISFKNLQAENELNQFLKSKNVINIQQD